VPAEKLATSHSEGLGLPEESVFSLFWRRKSDPSLRLGWQKSTPSTACTICGLSSVRSEPL